MASLYAQNSNQSVAHSENEPLIQLKRTLTKHTKQVQKGLLHLISNAFNSKKWSSIASVLIGLMLLVMGIFEILHLIAGIFIHSSELTPVQNKMEKRDMKEMVDQMFIHLDQEMDINFEVNLVDAMDLYCVNDLKPALDPKAMERLHFHFTDMFRWVVLRKGHIARRHFISLDGGIVDPQNTDFHDFDHLQSCPLLEELVERGAPTVADKDMKVLQAKYKEKVNEQKDEFTRPKNIDDLIHNALTAGDSDQDSIQMLGLILRKSIEENFDVYEPEMSILHSLNLFCPEEIANIDEKQKFALLQSIMTQFKKVMNSPPFDGFKKYVIDSSGIVFPTSDAFSHNKVQKCEFLDVLFNIFAYR